MAYYNPGYGAYYPAYPQQIPQQMPQPVQQTMPPPQQGNGIIWVQGEVGAKSYLVAPNNSVVLWDNENPLIYVKSADSSGMPTMRTFEYKERVGAQMPAQPATKQAEEYVPRAEFDALSARMDALAQRIDDRQAQRPVTRRTKEAEENGKPDV